MTKTGGLAGILLTLALAATPALAQEAPATPPVSQGQPAPAAPAQAAPAADAAAQPAATAPGGKPDWMTYKNPYAGEETDLANPHRNSDEISAWARQAATDVLSFGPTDYRTKLGAFKKYFGPTGWQTYADYLRSSNILSAVTTDGLTVGAIAGGQPEVVNSGPVDNVFHWIVKIPVTVSYYNKGADGAAKEFSSAKYTLFMDMARTATTDSDGISINNWRMDPVAPAQ